VKPSYFDPFFSLGRLNLGEVSDADDWSAYGTAAKANGEASPGGCRRHVVTELLVAVVHPSALTSKVNVPPTFAPVAGAALIFFSGLPLISGALGGPNRYAHTPRP
jgi:hypothetical protein